ncbi:MAG: c-type cytochrome [Dehalococcoidia bacterium]|nr:MAG: c-type cytochrome [Dehalococcoidia bacterium]
MNTSKQVNVMIGLLFVAFLTFGAYIARENGRAEAARENQEELKAERGATIFVNNCRTCHGLEGKGTEEGGIAPALNRPQFLVVPKGDKQYEPTPDGEATALHNFLFNTIACGRTNTAMPTWSEHHGGPLSDTQINYLVLMITRGRWDLVTEIGHEHDSATTPPTKKEDILVTDPAKLSLTTKNCGQFNPLTAKEFYDRDPLKPLAGSGAPAAAAAAPKAAPSGPTVQGVAVADFFQKTCATCHGNKRQGIVGPALTPAKLTNTDDFYFQTIKNGRPGTAMPSWGAAGLNEADIKALVTFIKTVEP